MIAYLISILFAILFHPKLRHVSAEPQSQSAAYRFTTHTTMGAWNNGHNYYNQNYKQNGQMPAQQAFFLFGHSHQQQHNYPMKMPPAVGSYINYRGPSQFDTAASYGYVSVNSWFNITNN
jgi:hypothetical protein